MQTHRGLHRQEETLSWPHSPFCHLPARRRGQRHPLSSVVVETSPRSRRPHLLLPPPSWCPHFPWALPATPLCRSQPPPLVDVKPPTQKSKRARGCKARGSGAQRGRQKPQGHTADLPRPPADSHPAGLQGCSEGRLRARCQETASCPLRRLFIAEPEPGEAETGRVSFLHGTAGCSLEPGGDPKGTSRARAQPPDHSPRPAVTGLHGTPRNSAGDRPRRRPRSPGPADQVTHACVHHASPVMATRGRDRKGRMATGSRATARAKVSDAGQIHGEDPQQALGARSHHTQPSLAPETEVSALVDVHSSR